ncbi:PRK06851 family protein [Bacillus sp. 31A1R]|uniref:PRK06851 family protein n=1 Tax=Robertmurraya mangrovi TaxID=3098077 RepID=A0ABU5IX56_9BACI|nr:PRK06851 family protein [Bacillus sp. 31A1R]MDZ5471716.1 PRK06851 family protein [Bacillus sp. 31A1R]
MSGKLTNYYAGGNTARGFYSLYESNLKDLDRLFILKGGPGTGKSSMMKAIGSYWLEKGYNIEYLHCSSDNNSIDGVKITELKVGIVDGTFPHVIEPKAPGVIEEYINLGEAWNSAKLRNEKEKITKLNHQRSEAFQNAYSKFGEALKIHDDWEKIFIENMDFEKANELTEKLIDQFYGELSLNKSSEVKHRFLGAATPKGAVDFVPNLTEEIEKRYFIKGRPGSGKSTMLKKIAAEAEDRGFDVEIYHCGFDPHSLDMVIVRELGWAIFDSTAPHEYFPTREGDEIIDMYGTIIHEGTDEKYAEEIQSYAKKYKDKMQEAIGCLAQAKNLHETLEGLYIEAMDFTVVNKFREQIQLEIKKIAEN